MRAAGIRVCCGGILGMGESRADRAGLLCQLARQEPHPESVPINLLVRVPGTPARAAAAALDPLEFARTVAAARVMLPRATVRLSAGREDMSDELQALCFLAGANSIFHGEKLLTTPNADADADRALFARLGLAARATTARARTPESRPGWRPPRPRPPPCAGRRLLRGADAAGGTTLDGAPQAVLCDNDYLGLARDPRLAEAMHAAARRHGAGAAAASPLVTGYTDAHRDLEEALAEFTGRERGAGRSPPATLANLGAVQALAGRGDVLVEDRRNHASLIDAARASSRARCRRYRHADAGHARRR